MKSARYTCHTGKKEYVARIGEISEKEAMRRGLIKARRPVRLSNRTEDLPVWVEPACDGLETTDPEVFEAHMREVHGKRPLHGVSEQQMGRLLKGGGMWRTPPRSAKPIPGTQTCERCGLVAEVDDRPANVLWWDEHTRMCTGTESAVA